MAQSLSQRQKEYEFASDYRLLRKLPVIIRVDGKSFSKLTRKLDKPYCTKMMGLMSNTMLEVCKQIEGAIFAYQQSDEITFILKNDQSLESEPWFANRIQKVVSITSALTTYHFNNLYGQMTIQPDLKGQAIFDARVFIVPNVNEAINNLIFRQQDCIRNAITAACQYELGQKHGKKTAAKILHKKNSTERKKLLLDECNIDFHTFYPRAFRNGIAAYKIPKVIENNSGQLIRHQWSLDTNLFNFTDNKEFINTILTTGRDIFRAERDIKCTPPLLKEEN